MANMLCMAHPTICFFVIEFFCVPAKGQGIRKSEAMGKNEKIEFAVA
jgi:hypothetical protein